MSILVSTLARSAGYVNFNSANFFTKEKINCRILPGWEPVSTSMFGPVDKFKKDLVLKLSLKLWGAYENLGILFPGYLMNPIPGTSIFGATNTPLVVQGRNNDTLTYVNAAVTKIANLFLGVDSDFFSADVEFTAVLGRAASALMTPESASSYTTRGTNAYSDATAAFAKTNFTKTRYTCAWGAVAGFTSAAGQKGIAVDFDCQLDPIMVDGYGTVDYSVKSMIATAKMVLLQPTLAQIKTQSQEETAHGTLASAASADLVMAGNNSGPVITLKNAFIKENGIVFDTVDLRVGEATWETTRGIISGVPSAVAAAA